MGSGRVAARRRRMPREHVISIDPSKPLGEEPATGHNRWHEAIEPAVEVDPGDTVVYETRDTFDGQRNDASTAKDVGNLDLTAGFSGHDPYRIMRMCGLDVEPV